MCWTTCLVTELGFIVGDTRQQKKPGFIQFLLMPCGKMVYIQHDPQSHDLNHGLQQKYINSFSLRLSLHAPPASGILKLILPKWFLFVTSHDGVTSKCDITRRTGGQMGPILLPRPLTREVITYNKGRPIDLCAFRNSNLIQNWSRNRVIQIGQWNKKRTM